MFGNKAALIKQYRDENRELRATIRELTDTAFHKHDVLLNIGDIIHMLDNQVNDGLFGNKRKKIPQ